MTKANLERYAGSAWIDFWRNLKEGYDAFEATQIPPEIGVCNKKYVVHEVAPGDAAADKRIPGSNGNRRNASRDFECASKTAAVTEQDAGEGADTSASRGVALKPLSHRSPAVASEASGETQPTSKQ
jgi:murein L,D-transpeptidase YafK